MVELYLLVEYGSWGGNAEDIEILSKRFFLGIIRTVVARRDLPPD